MPANKSLTRIQRQNHYFIGFAPDIKIKLLNLLNSVISEDNLQAVFTGFKGVLTLIAFSSKVFLMAAGAVDLVIFESKWFIHKRNSACAAEEAFVMPVMIFICQILNTIL